MKNQIEEAIDGSTLRNELFQTFNTLSLLPNILLLIIFDFMANDLTDVKILVQPTGVASKEILQILPFRSPFLSPPEFSLPVTSEQHNEILYRYELPMSIPGHFVKNIASSLSQDGT